MVKYGKMQRVVMGGLVTMLVASLVLAAVSFFTPSMANAGPVQPLEDCEGCIVRYPDACWSCRWGIDGWTWHEGDEFWMKCESGWKWRCYCGNWEDRHFPCGT